MRNIKQTMMDQIPTENTYPRSSGRSSGLTSWCKLCKSLLKNQIFVIDKDITVDLPVENNVVPHPVIEKRFGHVEQDIEQSEEELESKNMQKRKNTLYLGWLITCILWNQRGKAPVIKSAMHLIWSKPSTLEIMNKVNYKWELYQDKEPLVSQPG